MNARKAQTQAKLRKPKIEPKHVGIINRNERIVDAIAAGAGVSEVAAKFELAPSTIKTIIRKAAKS